MGIAIVVGVLFVLFLLLRQPPAIRARKTLQPRLKPDSAPVVPCSFRLEPATKPSTYG